MLDHRRRSQLRLEPIAATPPMRTTTRRTRRLCLNIETNGAGPLRSRRRRRSVLPDPYYMTFPPVYEANPWLCGDWRSNIQFYGYENFVNPLNRLYAGEEYEYDPVNGFILPEGESDQNLYASNSDQKAAGDLQNILMSLNGYLQEENNMESENNVELDPETRVPEEQGPHNSQIAVLIDVISDTIGRLNNYITAKNPEQMDIQKLTPPPRPPPPVQVLPVQPMILPPIFSNSSIYPPNNPYVMEPECRPNKLKNFFERLPWLKERKRKRHAKAVTRVQNQSCGTDDLNTLPKILEASNSRGSTVPMNFYRPPMKDTSTTMWCPMKCTECCGLVRTQEQKNLSEDTSDPMTISFPLKGGLDTTQEQKKPFEDFEVPSSITLRCPMKSSSFVRIPEQEKPFQDFKIPSPTQEQENPSEDVEISSPMKRDLVRTQEQKKPSEGFRYPSPIGVHFSTSLIRAPPPSLKSEDDMDGNHEMNLYHPRKISSYSSICNYHRHAGGNLIYSYVEEEQLEQGAEEDHVDEDEWYQGASYKLAELELEQEYFKEIQKQGEVITRDQQQQTDDSRSVNIIITTDKAVSTTDLIELPYREPVKIVRICKRSSLKPTQRLTSSSCQSLKTKGCHKVKFEREHQPPIAPEVVTIGRCPMDWEETARSINRCCPKRFHSSSNSKEKQTYRDQSY